MSARTQLLNLVAELRDEMGMAYLFIWHALSVVWHVADHITAMYLGRIVEVGPATELSSGPLHPYTETLLSAVSSTRASHRRMRLPFKGNLPSPLDPSSGCRFCTRWPKATVMCAADILLMRCYGPGHLTACHHVDGRPSLLAAEVH